MLLRQLPKIGTHIAEKSLIKREGFRVLKGCDVHTTCERNFSGTIMKLAIKMCNWRRVKPLAT